MPLAPDESVRLTTELRAPLPMLIAGGEGGLANAQNHLVPPAENAQEEIK